MTLQKVIPAYLYSQYADDDDVQALFDAFNQVGQDYLDFFNQIGLPVYTGALIAGPLLDWVGQGVYDIARPVLTLVAPRTIGPFNTYVLNSLPFNTRRTIAPTAFLTLSDDYYRRVLTWHIYMGDGRAFSIRWLKRRIARFLYGINGQDLGTADTSAISVQMAAGDAVTVTIATTANTRLAADILKAAVASGALETPFQFAFSVVLTP